MTSVLIYAVLCSTAPSVYFLTGENLYETSVKISAGLFWRGHAATFCYSVFEHALARQIKHEKIVSDFVEKKVPSIDEYIQLQAFGFVRTTGALLIASSWHLQTVQLHRELTKHAMRAWASKGSREGLCPLGFEIISKQKIFFQFRGVKNKFHHFWPSLETILPTPMNASVARQLNRWLFR